MIVRAGGGLIPLTFIKKNAFVHQTYMEVVAVTMSVVMSSSRNLMFRSVSFF